MSSKRKRIARVTRLLIGLVATAMLAPATPAHATYPGVNGKIAFEHANQIYTMNPDGSGQGVLDDLLRDASPVWSPDGRQLLFSSCRNRDAGIDPFCGVFAMSSDGGNVHKLPLPGIFPDGGLQGQRLASWSPDGGQIAFRTFLPDQPYLLIYTINVDGSGLTPITEPLQFALEPAWSPSGSKIAFSARFDPLSACCDEDIWTMNPDGSGKARITQTPATADTNPSWSPDGKQIAFTEHGPTFGDVIAKVNADGSGETILSTLPGGYHMFCPYACDRQPVWSPDGTKIAFVSTRDRSSEIYIMNADGSDQTRVTNASDRFVGSIAPDWQPLPPSAFKNAAEFCHELRRSIGEPTFRQRYGVNGNGANAFSRCVIASGE